MRIEDGGTDHPAHGHGRWPGVARRRRGAPGDLVTLLPIDGLVEGVTTHDLRYPLRAEPLTPGPARGLSNVMSRRRRPRRRPQRGRLLVIHTRQTTPEGTP